MKSLIICQAPLKINGVLNCYENEIKNGNDVFIVVRNAFTMYQFIESLNLTAKLFYFEPHESKINVFLTPWLIHKKINNDLKRLVNEGIQFDKNTKVFFTDCGDDLLIGFYLNKLSHCKEISKIQVKSDLEYKWDDFYNRPTPPLKIKIKEYYLSMVSGHKLFYRFVDRWVIHINMKDYKYQMKDYSEDFVYTKYKYKQCEGENGRTALLFTEPYRNHFQTESNYNLLNEQIVSNLHKKGYKVAVKGHPRIGCNKNALKLSDFEIPSYIPSEFLDIHSFDLVIGFVSTAICNIPSDIPSYSVLPLCTITNQIEANYWYNYINELGHGRVILLTDWSMIKGWESEGH